MDSDNSQQLAVDAALEAVGVTNDHQLKKRGGPRAATMRSLRSGRPLRIDALRRLAAVLGVSESVASTIVEATVRAALEGQP